MHYVALFTAITLGVAGQTLFRLGSDQIAGVPAWKFFFNPAIFFGASLYFVSTVFYVYALKSIPLSIAYPAISVSYIFVAMIGYYVFGESMSALKIAGLLLILFGVSLLFWRP